ncbi:hypothetical protein [Pinibacter soli]|uniref:Outer membrane protein beta-barrel domain-containing protein n=1 Tax=Pinibacter soli TaxID=3044211 RepID=A0ABT6REH9_9BACT|nr:hypothetical protein [Pinibacter soli]MDI3320935.1 hypothetical protein [Pinibacter soli]
MHKIFILFIFYFLRNIATAQDKPVDSTQAKWTFSASGYYYFIPEEKNTGTLIGYADHKSLHLEARYNYEDLKTVSAFAGWRFETGEKFQFAATPMVGLAAGNSNGLIPALELEASYKIFDLYSESEYLIDFADKGNNFFYVWSELAVTPINSLRTGISIQRTRLYQTSLDTQRGIFAEYSFWKLTAGVYYFNPFSIDNFVIASLSIYF